MNKVREGYKMTELGEIPNEWNIMKLSEVAEIVMGQSPDSSSYNDIGDGVAFFQGKTEFGRINPVVKKWCNNPTKISKPLDILISVRAPVGDVNINNIEACIGRGLGAIRQTGKSNYKYLYYAIQKYNNQLQKASQGSTFEAINSNDLKGLKLPMPLINEQEKIASILSTVDEQIDNVDALIEKNKELKKGLMQTLLTKGIGHTKFKKTEIGEIPEEWTLVKIGDVAKFQAGYAFKSSDYVDNGVKLVKITNVQQKDIVWNDTDFLPEEFLNKYKEYSLDIDDVIIAMTRPIISSGIKICKVKKEDIPALLNQRVGRFITSENVNNKYLYQYCFSNYFINKVNELCSTTGQPNISSNQLESIMISLPSTEEQEKIGSILFKIDEKIEEYQNKKQKLEEIKKGLMQQLLTGKIRVL